VLEEVYRLLSELKAAWDAIGAQAGSQASAAQRPVPAESAESAESAQSRSGLHLAPSSLTF